MDLKFPLCKNICVDGVFWNRICNVILLPLFFLKLGIFGLTTVGKGMGHVS